jgi:hypothetical protein
VALMEALRQDELGSVMWKKVHEKAVGGVREAIDRYSVYSLFVISLLSICNSKALVRSVLDLRVQKHKY